MLCGSHCVRIETLTNSLRSEQSSYCSSSPTLMGKTDRLLLCNYTITLAKTKRLHICLLGLNRSNGSPVSSRNHKYNHVQRKARTSSLCARAPAPISRIGAPRLSRPGIIIRPAVR